PAQLRKGLTTGTRQGLAGLKVDVPKSAEVKMPHRGGYAQLLAKAIRVSIRVSNTGQRVTAKVDVSAKGKTETRDVAQRNRGVLRHPDIRDLHNPRKPRAFWRWHGQPVP